MVERGNEKSIAKVQNEIADKYVRSDKYGIHGCGIGGPEEKQHIVVLHLPKEPLSSEIQQQIRKEAAPFEVKFLPIGRIYACSSQSQEMLRQEGK